MTDLTAMTEEAIPSRRRPLLTALQAASIVRMTRYSWSPKATVALEDQIPSELVFSRTAGPLLVTLDSGIVIGAASQPSLASVTLWLEQSPRTSSDPELYPIEADDPTYSEPGFANMLGKRVTWSAVLTRDADSVKTQDLPREAGVVLAFDGAPDLILSHGLHDDSDDFSVIMRDGVRSSLWSRLHEARLG
jgi:hypothetical protein